MTPCRRIAVTGVAGGNRLFKRVSQASLPEVVRVGEIEGYLCVVIDADYGGETRQAETAIGAAASVSARLRSQRRIYRRRPVAIGPGFSGWTRTHSRPSS